MTVSFKMLLKCADPRPKMPHYANVSTIICGDPASALFCRPAAGSEGRSSLRRVPFLGSQLRRRT
jgi:hypothetical protein